MPAKIKDLVGKRFNKLVVLSDCGRSSDGSVLWLCKCDCGNTIKARGRQLKVGDIVSCGCHRILISRKYNTYETVGDITYVFDLKGNRAIVDTEKLSQIKEYYWFKRGNYFVTVTQHKNKPLSLHRFVLGVSDTSVDIDHINRDTFDDREVNLRVATRSQNNINRNCCRVNSSGYTGVSKMKNNKYRAYIGVDNKHIHLGVFDTPEEAYEHRLKAEKEYYEDFSSKGGDVNYE